MTIKEQIDNLIGNVQSGLNAIAATPPGWDAKRLKMQRVEATQNSLNVLATALTVIIELAEQAKTLQTERAALQDEVDGLRKRALPKPGTRIPLKGGAPKGAYVLVEDLDLPETA